MMTGIRVVVLAGILAAGAVAARAWPESFATGPAPRQWFGPRSPWNLATGTAPAAPYSKAAITAYVERGHGVNMNWGSAGVYVVYAGGSGRDGGTARDLVFAASDGTSHWRIPAVPMPAGLLSAARYRLAQGNTDGMTCVVDTRHQRFLSFWQPRPDGDGIVIRTGGATSFSGAGWSRLSPRVPSLGRAAGANYCGGLIRETEMRAGVIRHALALAWPKDLIRAPHSPFGGMQYPATFSDGTDMTSPNAVPMGARLQLDPALGDDALRAMGLVKPADLVIAHAMQRYGGYIVDSNTPTMGGSIYFESRFDRGDAVYGATNPWPLAVMRRMRFVIPPPTGTLDTFAPMHESARKGQ